MGKKPTCTQLEKRIAELEKIKIDSEKTKRTLEETLTRYRTLYESANDAIFVMEDARFVHCNSKTLEIYGCTEEQIIGKTPFHFSPKHQPDGQLSEKKGSKVIKLALQGTPQCFEWKHQKHDGTIFDAEVSLNRIAVSGEVYLQPITRDVTKRKQAEEALRKALSEIAQLRTQLEADYTYLREEIKLTHNFDEIIGQSDVLKQVLFRVEQIAPTDTTVLILGETGVGKELFARAIHHASPRKERPLVKVNCATLPSNLMESELFGHEKGAFTGAQSKQVGRFELADGTSMLLDEVGELPLELQAKLLRVLRDGEFERLGSARTLRTDARIIAATNRNLEEEVRRGNFREDLWYRLNVFPITVPPLRERKEDIALIVKWFVNNFATRFGKSVKTIPQQAIKALQGYPWPGNVRELENVIERSVIISQGPVLTVDLPSSRAASVSESRTLKDIERDHILQVLEETRWKIEGPHGTAQTLGLNPGTLRSRMKKLGIQRPKVPR